MSVNYRPLYIYGITDQKEFGNAYQCKKTQIIAMYYTSFWGYKSESIRRIPIKLTSNECWILKLSNKCGNNLMTCDGDNCRFYPTLTPDHSWNSDIRVVYEECIISTRFISAKDLDSKVIAPHCAIKDKQCSLHDSIVVWSKTIIHDCPLYDIGKGYFKWENNILVSTEETHLAFQPISIVEHCGSKVVLTSDGLFLSLYMVKTAIKDMNGIKNIKSLMDMSLADRDFDKVTAIKKRKEIVKDLCSMVKMNLKMHMHETNSYFRIPDLSGNEIIMYANEGNIYKPLCTKIKQLTLLETTKCYENMPIEFVYKNKNVRAFLDTDNIISQVGNEKTCQFDYSKYFIQNKSAAVYTGNKIQVIDNSKIHTQDLNMINGRLEDSSLTHPEIIINGITEHDKNEDNLNTRFDPNSEDSIDDKLTDFKDSVVNNIFSSSILKVLSIILILAVLAISMVSIFMLCNPITKLVRYIKRRCKQRELPNYNEVALQPINPNRK
jgi:hypothetical protein